MTESQKVIAAQTLKLHEIADEQAALMPIINGAKFLGPDIKEFAERRFESMKQRCRDRIAAEQEAESSE